MTVDRSEDELRVWRPGWKKDMMRFSGGKKQRRKKCVFSSQVGSSLPTASFASDSFASGTTGSYVISP